MRINRLFEIIYILLDKKQTTARELSQIFEVSIRTIYRDIDILSYSGIPLYTTQGKNGGIFIDENFILNKTFLTNKEQEQILFTLQSFSSNNNFKTKNLYSRLSNLFNKQNKEWIEIDFSSWKDSKEDNYKFNLIKDSIINFKELNIEYLNSNGECTNRDILPIKLLFKSKDWYLQSYCKFKNDYRLFKLNRIISIKNNENYFNESTLKFPKQNEKIYPNKINLKLKFAKEVAFRVYDEFNNKDITKDENNNLIIKTNIPEGTWLNNYILSYGSYVEILEPLYLKNSIIKEISKIDKIYKK